MASEIGHFVGNKRTAGQSGRTGEVTNPATGEVTAKVAFASEAEIDAAVASATRPVVAWARGLFEDASATRHDVAGLGSNSRFECDPP